MKTSVKNRNQKKKEGKKVGNYAKQTKEEDRATTIKMKKGGREKKSHLIEEET